MTEIPRVAAPLRDETVRALRAALMKGEYAPGERLNEKDMCARLRVSRSTLRESFRQLETERLIVLVAGQGPVVATLSQREATQIYEVRAALESLAVQIFTTRGAPSEIEKLKKCVVVLQSTVDDVEDFLTAKDELYGILLRGADNDVLTDQLRGLSTRINRLRHLSLARPGRIAESLQELIALVDAISRGDANEASRLCAQHVRNAAQAALGQWGSNILAGGDSAN